MNLTSLTLENFGKFENFECSLTPGLNIIKGGNETGKSTLVEAITALLFCDPGSSCENIMTSKTWGSSKPLVMKANISDKDFLGIIEKDFDSGLTKLVDENQAVPADDKDKIFEIITGSIGFRSAELYEATSCVKQGKITQIGGSVEEIKDNLGSLVTGGEEDLAASEIIARIDKRICDITGTDENNPGLLMKYEHEQNNLDYNIEKIIREVNNLKNWRSSLAQMKIAYTNVVDDLQCKKKQLEDSSKAEETQQELKRVLSEKNETAEKLEKIKSTSIKINELTELRSQVIEVSSEDSERIEDLESTIKYLRPKQKELETDIESCQKAWDNFKINPGILGWMVISLGIFGFSVVDYMMLLTGYCFDLGAVGLVSLMASMVILSRANQKKTFLKEQLNSNSKKLEDTKENINQMSEELKNLLANYKISSASEVHQASWKRSDLNKQLDSEKQHYSNLLEGYSEEEIEIQLQNLEKDISDNEAFLKNNVPLESAELERMKLIVTQLEEQYNTLENEIKSLNRLIETAEGGFELLGSYLERKEAASSKKINLVEELATLSLTKECIEKARQNVMISTLELLEKRTSEILQIITNDKYNKVRFDKSSLQFEVFSEMKKGWVNPHRELSKETVEQIYLTARLAMTEILVNDVSPPIILDDPFSSFDQERRESTMKLLKQMSENRQILLLTTDDEYDRWADNTVQL